MNNNFCFGKSLRLLNASQFQAVFDQVDYRVSNSHALFLARSNTLDNPRLGLVIAKKNIRHAYQRNRIKRHLRETFRLQQHNLPAVDVIVLTRKGLDHLNDKEMHKEFDKLWQSLTKKVNKHATNSD